MVRLFLCMTLSSTLISAWQGHHFPSFSCKYDLKFSRCILTLYCYYYTFRERNASSIVYTLQAQEGFLRVDLDTPSDSILAIFRLERLLCKKTCEICTKGIFKHLFELDACISIGTTSRALKSSLLGVLFLSNLLNCLSWRMVQLFIAVSYCL